MAGTTTIPLTALAVGSHDFGPVAVADTDSQAVLSVDRTVSKGATQGFNGQPATTQASIQVQQSNDGGTTWKLEAAADIIGGLLTNPKTGQPYTASTLTISLDPGTSRQVKATIVVSGANVAAAGSLTIT